MLSEVSQRKTNTIRFHLGNLKKKKKNKNQVNEYNKTETNLLIQKTAG